MITLELGLEMERAALGFWQRVSDRIERGEFPTAPLWHSRGLGSTAPGIGVV